MSTITDLKREIDQLYIELEAAYAAEENGDITSAYIDGLQRQLEDASYVLAALERQAARTTRNV